MKCSDVNALLDRLMDDELSDEMRIELNKHASVCPQCAEMINATIEMKEMLTEMHEEADVPLAAQAAWRKAVKQEAVRIKARKFYHKAGTVAAAVVVLVGIGIAVTNRDMAPQKAQNDVMQISADYETAEMEEAADISQIAAIESDGSGETAASMARTMPAPSEFTAINECILCVEDIDETFGYISDLVAEYEGNVDEYRAEDNRANLYITLPTENVGEFLSASKHLDTSGSAFENVKIGSEEMTTLLLILNG